MIEHLLFVPFGSEAELRLLAILSLVVVLTIPLLLVGYFVYTLWRDGIKLGAVLAASAFILLFSGLFIDYP